MKVTTSTTTQRAMEYIGANAAVLAAAYNVSAWADEVCIQGDRDDVIELVRTLGLTYDARHSSSAGGVMAIYRGRAAEPYADLRLRLVIGYSPVTGVCRACDPTATGAHYEAEHHLSPLRAAINDRDSFQAVTA